MPLPERRPLPDPRSLSLPEKIGQLLCFGWSDPDALYDINDQARNAVSVLKCGALLVMGRNVQRPDSAGILRADPPAARKLFADLKALGDIPPLISTDQEGGRVERFRAPFTRMPPAADIGATKDIRLAADAARVIGEELAAVGVDWDFAPDADIRSAKTNGEIGDRSFGMDTALVSAMTAAQAAGLQRAGVLPGIKHFPGQGDTEIDSHQGLPLLKRSRAELMARELVPFAHAARERIPSMMVAHILIPAFEPARLPATLSRAILTGLLRRTLGYNGLVITDDLEMTPIADGWGVGRAAVMAIGAGADMVLVAHSTDAQNNAFSALLSAAHRGKLPLARIDEAVGRVFAAKRWVASRPPAPPLSVIGCAEHQAVRAAILARTNPAKA